MIEIKNITKNFETTKALNNVNLTIENGKIYGLLGSNRVRYILKAISTT